MVISILLHTRSIFENNLPDHEMTTEEVGTALSKLDFPD